MSITREEFYKLPNIITSERDKYIINFLKTNSDKCFTCMEIGIAIGLPKKRSLWNNLRKLHEHGFIERRLEYYRMKEVSKE